MRNLVIFSEISNNPIDDSFERLLPLVSKERQKRIAKFRFDIDKKLSLYAELIVRRQAQNCLLIKSEDIYFDQNEYGKLSLLEYPNFHFNISHTRNAVAVAFSDEPIGIDVEKLWEADTQIAHRFFTANEVDYIENVAEEKNRRFYEIWTKKEAYIKRIGKGLSTPLDSFDVTSEELRSYIITRQIGEYIISLSKHNKFKGINFEIVKEDSFLQICEVK